MGIFTSPGTKFIRPCLSPYSPSPLGLIIPCHHIAHFLPSSLFSRVYPPQGLTVFIAHHVPVGCFNYPCAAHMHHHPHLPCKIPEPIKSSTHLIALQSVPAVPIPWQLPLSAPRGTSPVQHHLKAQMAVLMPWGFLNHSPTSNLCLHTNNQTSKKQQNQTRSDPYP